MDLDIFSMYLDERRSDTKNKVTPVRDFIREWLPGYFQNRKFNYRPFSTLVTGFDAYDVTAISPGEMFGGGEMVDGSSIGTTGFKRWDFRKDFLLGDCTISVNGVDNFGNYPTDHNTQEVFLRVAGVQSVCVLGREAFGADVPKSVSVKNVLFNYPELRAKRWGGSARITMFFQGLKITIE